MEVQNILLSMIRPSAMNPRKTFDAQSLDELAQNIKEQGLLQPITVRIVEWVDLIDEDTLEITSVPRFEIVCGERRYRACMLNNMEMIPAIIVEMDDKQAFEAMITENLQRKDVDPIEEAFAFDLLLKNGNTAEDVALRFGKSVRFVQDRMRLNGLNDDIKKMVRDGHIPLTGAFIIAKLEPSTQEKFSEWANDEYDLEDETETIPVASIKRWIDNRFMILSRSIWAEDEDNGEEWTTEFKMCSQCEFNTCNHGCLFYEMNNDNARCTNASCFEKKGIAYILHKLSELDMVMEGEDIVHGKMVVVETHNVWGNESAVIKAVQEAGYKTVKLDFFSHQCWYDEDDDRTKELLKNEEIYPCIMVNNYGTLNFRKVFYYLKKDQKNEGGIKTDSTTTEKNKLVEQHKRNIEIAQEKGVETMREWARTKEYYKRQGELTDNEQTAFDIMLLKGCSGKYLRTQKLREYLDRAEVLEYIRNNQGKRLEWMREFMRNRLESSDVTYNGAMQACQDLVFKDAYEKEYLEMSHKLAESLEKKNSKIRAKLAEMGYDVHGMKLKEA